MRKYLSILFILSVFPLVHFIANRFILESSSEIYTYIPQESDVVIEINARSFLKEIMYQKVYNEGYFNRKLFPPQKEVSEQPEFDLGIDFFSKIVLFRERWSDELIWVAIVPYTDKNKLNSFVDNDAPDSKVFFNEEFAFIQLSPSVNQKKLDEHLNNIVAGKIKPFSDRIDLKSQFSPDKEINVYLVHESLNTNSKLIDGFLSFDFLKDEIAIAGEFIPVSGLENSPSIAYELNNDVAFSLRSSLNLFNSIYWFSQEKINNIPAYSQMAFDYDGVKIFLCDKNLGYDFPLKSFPEMQLHFDLTECTPWESFIADLKENGDIKVDSVAHLISTRMGTFFQYELTDSKFELTRGTPVFVPKEPSNVYFSMQLKVDPLLDNCKFEVDEQNPPGSAIEQAVGIGIANEMVAEMKLIATMESFNMNITLSDDKKMIAEGHGVMKEKNGHSVIESMQFGLSAILFLKNYF